VVPCQGGADSGHAHMMVAIRDIKEASNGALAMAIPDKISKSFYYHKIVQCLTKDSIIKWVFSRQM
jgi:hypothetical protein